MRNSIFIVDLVKIYALLFAILASPVVNSADTPTWNQDGVRALALNSFDAVDIILIDDVQGGCMTQPAAVKKSAEIQLRRNNFKIGDNTTFAVPYMSISALGYRQKARNGTDLGCTVYVEVRLQVAIVGIPYKYIKKPVGEDVGIFHHDFLLGSSLLADSSAASMQARIEKEVEDAVDELFLGTRRAKDLLEKNFPDALALSD